MVVVGRGGGVHRVKRGLFEIGEGKRYIHDE